MRSGAALVGLVLASVVACGSNDDSSGSGGHGSGGTAGSGTGGTSSGGTSSGGTSSGGTSTGGTGGTSTGGTGGTDGGGTGGTSTGGTGGASGAPGDAGKCVSGAWTLTKLDSGSGATLAVCPDGSVDVEYYHPKSGSSSGLFQLRRLPGGPWGAPLEIVSMAAPSMDLPTSSECDASNGLHVSYYNLSSAALMYSHAPSGGAWASPEAIDAQPVGLGSNSLAIDPSGGLHVVYTRAIQAGQTDLEYAYRPAAGSWQTSTILTGGNLKYPSVAADAGGSVHVSYYDAKNGDLGYVTKPSGGGWQTPVTLDSTGDVGVSSAIAADASGSLHVAYHDNTKAILKYVYRPQGGAWQTPVTVDTSGNTGQNGRDIAIDVSAAGVRIAYAAVAGIPLELRYVMKPAGGSWQAPVALESNAGYRPSIASDASGGVHVSYLTSGSDVKYAFRCP